MGGQRKYYMNFVHVVPEINDGVCQKDIEVTSKRVSLTKYETNRPLNKTAIYQSILVEVNE